MCLARVHYVGDNGHAENDAITDVARIDRTPEGLRVTGLVGVVRELDGEIRSIDFLESVVSVEKRGTPTAST